MLGRRLAGRRTGPPNREVFRRELEDALARLPDGLNAARAWIDLPATEPPSRDSGVDLLEGDQVSYLAVGCVYASRPLDIWIQPRNQIWTKIGSDGEIISFPRNSNTVVAKRSGRLLFGNYFPNDWLDRGGARLNSDSVYDEASGEVRTARGFDSKPRLPEHRRCHLSARSRRVCLPQHSRGECR
ncbi:MAG: hypothetical protein GY725_00310 [bacterium]|nr:hypothetical protein [bacterium]